MRSSDDVACHQWSGGWSQSTGAPDPDCWARLGSILCLLWYLFNYSAWTYANGLNEDIAGDLCVSDLSSGYPDMGSTHLLPRYGGVSLCNLKAGMQVEGPGVESTFLHISSGYHDF